MNTAENYDYIKLFTDEAGFGFDVKGYKEDGYPSYSVLAGRTRIDFIDAFDTVEEAIEAFPALKVDGVIQWGDRWTDAQIKDVSHLPDEPDLQM